MQKDVQLLKAHAGALLVQVQQLLESGLRPTPVGVEHGLFSAGSIACGCRVRFLSAAECAAADLMAPMVEIKSCLARELGALSRWAAGCYA